MSINPRFNAVAKVVAEQYGKPVDSIKTESRFDEDLGGDSLDSVELAIGLEEKFQIEIPDEEGEKFTCVQDVLNYLDQHAA